jgi:hypothetical protein
VILFPPTPDAIFVTCQEDLRRIPEGRGQENMARLRRSPIQPAIRGFVVLWFSRQVGFIIQNTVPVGLQYPASRLPYNDIPERSTLCGNAAQMQYYGSLLSR